MKANDTLTPSALSVSPYAIDPDFLGERSAQLPGMIGVVSSDLFPDGPTAISLESPEIIRKQIKEFTLSALAKVDLSKIQPQDSVNILASHHGFSL